MMAVTGPAEPTAAAQEGVPSLQGAWDGALHAPPGPLAASFRLSRGENGWSGALSIPAEGVQGLPVADVRVTGDSLILEMSPTRRFRGRLAGR
jgi:hypothetical protein